MGKRFVEKRSQILGSKMNEEYFVLSFGLSLFILAFFVDPVVIPFLISIVFAVIQTLCILSSAKYIRIVPVNKTEIVKAEFKLNLEILLQLVVFNPVICLLLQVLHHSTVDLSVLITSAVTSYCISAIVPIFIIPAVYGCTKFRAQIFIFSYLVIITAIVLFIVGFIALLILNFAYGLFITENFFQSLSENLLFGLQEFSLGNPGMMETLEIIGENISSFFGSTIVSVFIFVFTILLHIISYFTSVNRKTHAENLFSFLFSKF